MKTLVNFSLFFILASAQVFAQSNPVVVTPVNNGFTVDFTLPAYSLRDTSLADIFNTTEIFKYVKLGDCLNSVLHTCQFHIG